MLILVGFGARLFRFFYPDDYFDYKKENFTSSFPFSVLFLYLTQYLVSSVQRYLFYWWQRTFFFILRAPNSQVLHELFDACRCPLSDWRNNCILLTCCKVISYMIMKFSQMLFCICWEYSLIFLLYSETYKIHSFSNVRPILHSLVKSI